MVNAPIWLDTLYSATTTGLSYYISVDGEPIFNGRAFARPNSNTISININKICQNYLSNELPDFRNYVSETVTHPNACRDFYLYNSGGTALESFRFLYDWSYEVPDMTTGFTMSHPINQHYAYGQFIFNTQYASTGTVSTTIVSNSNTGYCGDYAIYYLNAYGGWDSYLFEGKCRKMDNLTQYEYNKAFSNNTIEFEKNRYISEIEGSYELSTGLLTDEQADNFAFNLVGTNKAYLHNLGTGDIFPVMIDETNIEYKKYKNDRKIIEYTIRVKESQNRIRR